MKRLSITTLLVLAVLAAICLAVLRPFEPQLTIFEIVDLDRRHSYNQNAKHYEVTVANMGRTRLWVPDNRTPVVDATFNFDPGTEDFTFAYVKFDDRTLVGLEPGEGLVYDLFVSGRFRKIDFGVDVRDWRGRQCCYETRLRFVGETANGE